MKGYEAILETFKRNCAKIEAGEEPEGIHICFICGRPFSVDEAVFCERCNWWIAPCGHCACSADPWLRAEIEYAFRYVCGARCRLNPKKRKKRSWCDIPGWTPEKFLEFARKFFPELYARYQAGQLSYDELKGIIEGELRVHFIGA